MIIPLNKQQALDPDLKAIQQTNFTGNLDWGGNRIQGFSLLKTRKKTILDFSQGTQ